MLDVASSPAAESVANQNAERPAGAVPPRRVPDMRVVTKGWWTLREERVPVEVLEQEDRERARKTARNGH
jgi:hypothetical protein